MGSTSTRRRNGTIRIAISGGERHATAGGKRDIAGRIRGVHDPLLLLQMFVALVFPVAVSKRTKARPPGCPATRSSTGNECVFVTCSSAKVWERSFPYHSDTPGRMPIRSGHLCSEAAARMLATGSIFAISRPVVGEECHSGKHLVGFRFRSARGVFASLPGVTGACPGGICGLTSPSTSCVQRLSVWQSCTLGYRGAVAIAIWRSLAFDLMMHLGLSRGGVTTIEVADAQPQAH
jgi:hypothetical protein